MFCEYGCRKEAKYQLKNGKWCCSESQNTCSAIKEKNRLSQLGKKHSKKSREKMSIAHIGKKHSKESKEKMSIIHKGKKFSSSHKNKLRLANLGENCYMFGKKHSEKTKEKMRVAQLGKKHSTESKEKLRNSHLGKKQSQKSIEKRKLTTDKIKKRYPFFSRIEEMRYNPDKPGEKEIQVHCKNHLCENSKEKGGWFTPTYIQLYERIRNLEKEYGNDGAYFYCSQECKNVCPLFNLYSDPYKETKKQYTELERKQFNDYVLERDNNQCQYCGEKAEHVHHERPVKLEPFFALDPDYAWSVCKKCHYKYGHKDECSTSNIAKMIC